jgi:hypothetical protein
MNSFLKVRDSSQKSRQFIAEETLDLKVVSLPTDPFLQPRPIATIFATIG